jgi:hypothetical protein
MRTGLGATKFHPEPALIPHELGTSELVARFIYSSSRMSVTTGRIKPSAFDPPPDGALSAVHSTGLLDADVWSIGLLTLSSQPGRSTIHGRADIPVKALIDQALKAILDNKPFLRHTSVVGWPDSSDVNERKALTKLICLKLSENPSIKLVRPDTPITHS